MKALLVEPMEPPRAVEISDDLATYQQLVGGLIQFVYPFPEDNVGLVCNDEGKLLHLPPNRFLRTESGVPYDVICGTFVVVGLEADHCCSLTEEQLTHYHALYSREMLLPFPKQPERGGKNHEAR